MMTINLETGALNVEQFRFSTKTEISYLSEKLNPSDFELWSSNDSWKSYRLINDRLIFILNFKNIFLEAIHICPSEKESDLTISKIIEKLGGEREYLWGSIELNNDKKGGFTSVLIKYF